MSLSAADGDGLAIPAITVDPVWVPQEVVAPVPAPVAAFPLAAFPVPHLGTTYDRFVKPAFDRVAALVLLLGLLPVLVAVALLVRWKLGSPVLFRQRRVGRGGVEFDVLKFRTMAHDRRSGRDRRTVDRQLVVPIGAEFTRRSPRDRRVTHKHPDDPRLGPTGRFLRKWSLDELPQLINVLKGDMSLVGPRPELVQVVSRYPPHVHRRHAVKPGITGFWQVAARRDGLMCENPELDLAYVERQSPLLDLSILLRTPAAALGGQKGS